MKSSAPLLKNSCIRRYRLIKVSNIIVSDSLVFLDLKTWQNGSIECSPVTSSSRPGLEYCFVKFGLFLWRKRKLVKDAKEVSDAFHRVDWACLRKNVLNRLS